ncbi:MAG TPA: TIGR01777 family oxidoreductase [Leptospiraceae bacterium]|nr:TIGR01777 family oxidoreductase [Leptospiraceae bacterium]HMY66735.1 TIGR01777 family oxidoreductase [Leptospiraceae bacterium]HNF25300.1 TIGR01777 family oxidoreductase [Leptospiraceae bacterium]HNI27765.1 TIGR01777 family oxidoreductase [Leptospiraceae bacterium]HNI95556.1 TIGR01777 family oxidoreductase [Leptospiraceae bacterium]
MKKIAVFGGTGLIGNALCRSLSDEFDVTVLSRGKSADTLNEKKIHFVRYEAPEKVPVEDYDIIINLAGEPILGGRWTEEKKRKISESRKDFTQKISNAILAADRKPELFICASAIGFYGMYEEGPEFTEDSDSGNDFLSLTCREWEESANAGAEKIRTVNARIGIVLSEKGGALSQMLTPFRLFAGGPVGSGKQFMSWIHVTDAVNAFRFIIQNSNIKGPVNLTSPLPSSNAEFSRVLGKVLHRPSWLPVPETALRILFGDGAEIVLKGQKVLPKRLLDSGFLFQFSNLESAMKNLLG